MCNILSRGFQPARPYDTLASRDFQVVLIPTKTVFRGPQSGMWNSAELTSSNYDEILSFGMPMRLTETWQWIS